MKPLQSEYQDKESLWALGRASVQIVHDLKNQINGLKLYATFLKKRMEKTDRPPDEVETVNKLIEGLDRTADDLSMIVQYGQPVSLKKRSGVDLQQIMRDVATSLNNNPRATGGLKGPVVVDSEIAALPGEFDTLVLTNALKSISLGALKIVNKMKEESLRILVKSETIETRQTGIIEWQVFDCSDRDLFHSFAGSDEIRMSLAAKAIESHGGSTERQNGVLRIRLPLGQ